MIFFFYNIWALLRNNLPTNDVDKLQVRQWFYHFSSNKITQLVCLISHFFYQTNLSNISLVFLMLRICNLF